MTRHILIGCTCGKMIDKKNLEKHIKTNTHLIREKSRHSKSKVGAPQQLLNDSDYEMFEDFEFINDN